MKTFPLLHSIVAALLLACTAIAQVAPATPFLDLSLEQALERGKQEQKQVMLCFSTSWHGQCKLMDSQTWTNSDVQAMIARRLIAVKLDPEQEKTLAARYRVSSYPSLVFLTSTGALDKKLVGFMDTAQFARALGEKIAPAKKPEEAKRQKKASGKRPKPLKADAFRREYVAITRHSVDAGFAVTNEELLALYDRRDVSDKNFRMEDFMVIFGKIRAIGASPGASIGWQEELGKRFEEARDAMMAEPKNMVHCHAYTALARVLRRTVEMADLALSLPADDPRRLTMRPHLYPELIQRRAYADALAAKPDEDFERMFSQSEAVALGRGPRPSTPERRLGAAFLGIQRVEVLAGAGRLEDAKRLSERVLACDNSELVQMKLDEAFARASQR